MKLNNICDKLSELEKLKVAVIGDYCLDQYMYIDAAHDKSHDYHQKKSYVVSHIESYPGGAGNVVKNFASLGVGVICVGVTGADGIGLELKEQLSRIGADTEYLITSHEKITNTCIRPIRKINNKTFELNEMLTENYTQTSEYLIDTIISNLQKVVKSVDAMVFIEQFDKEDFGIFNKKVKEKITQLALANDKIIFLADSRKYIDNYSNIYIKCNQYEFNDTLNYNLTGDREQLDVAELLGVINNLSNFKSIFITTGKDGMKVYNKNDEIMYDIPAINIRGKINTCGAGDSATVGIVIGLCLGYNTIQSAFLGNIIASVTIQDLHSTGSASVDDVIKILTQIEKKSSS